MTVSAQTPANSSTGNGVTTVFPYTFKILAAADLEVAVDGVVKALNTDYTVTGAGNNAGGNVVFSAAPASGTVVTRRRNMQIVRSTDYQDQGELPASVLNADQDAPLLILQQVNEQIGRSLKLPIGEAAAEFLPSAQDRAGTFLAFDADGDPVASSGTGADAGLRTDLVATGGADLVGYDGGTVQDVLDSAKAMQSYTALRAYTGRASGVRITQAGIAGFFALDGSDTSSADDGGTVIVDANGGRWKRLFSGAASVEWFGADKTGATDSTTALANARAFVAATGTKLVFPAGTYTYTTSPNWAIQDAQILSDGEVLLKCTGAGHGVLIDAGSTTSDHCYNVTFGRFLVAAATGGLDGVYVRGIHHSTIDVKVIGAASSRAGLRVEFAVCSRFPRLTVSANEGDMPPAGSAVPHYGAVLTERNAGEACSYCTFDTPVMEGLTEGIYCDYALGNLFLGGTSEGHSAYGIFLTPNASNNKMLGTDFESNGAPDIYCQGYSNAFIECDTSAGVTFDTNARTNLLQGGNHGSIVISASAPRNMILGARYNKLNNGATLSDSGAETRLADNLNVGAGTMHDAVPAVVVVAVGASPYTWTNTYGTDVIALVEGGTITGLSYSYAGTSRNVPYPGPMVVPSEGSIQVTYTSAPNFTVYKK